VDFSQQQVGDEIKLQSLAYTGVEVGMMEGMMDGMMPSAPLPNGAPFDILTVQVKRGVAATATLPAQLAKVERYQLAEAINAANPRSFVLSMANMQWLINGRAFAMESVDDNEKVALGSLELWEFSNQQDGAGMSGMSHMGGMDHSKMGGNMSMGMMNDFMAHVMHIHGVQFQVLERQVDPAQLAGWSTINAGLIDEGWKDTVLVMPGERVKLLVKFDQYRGRYLVHCHNLEHEDMDMMLNYQII
jgi:FtsP/CotA-like multicopper oxidase with cupredoxin domain